jgi:UDP-N-acetylglucosamine 3-dehydrogenase
MDRSAENSSLHMPLDVAILGSGNMGSRIVRALQKIPDVRIRYIYSRTFFHAEKLALVCDAVPLDQVDQIYDESQVSVVFDCLPTFTRLSTLQKCVASQKHIFCEKPLALNEQTADGVRNCLTGYEQVVTVGQVLRFFWEYSTLRQMVTAGDVGQVGTIRLSRCVGFPGAGSWFAQAEKSGGVILDLLIHDLDFLRWTFGEAKTIYAKSASEKLADGLDYALVSIQLQSDAIAHLEGSWAHPVGSFHQTVEICGSRGMLVYDNLASSRFHWISRAKSGDEAVSRISLPQVDPGNDPYLAEVQHFIHCVRHAKKPAVSWEDALHSCELAFCAIESTRSGQPVTVGTR